MNRNASIVLGHATYSYLNRYTEIRRNNFRPNNRSFILHSSRATCSSFNIVNRRPHTARISSAKEFLETSRQWLRRIAGVIRCYVCRTTWNSIRIASVSDTSDERKYVPRNLYTHGRKREEKFHASKRCTRSRQEKQDRANFFHAIARVQSQSRCIRGRFVDNSPCEIAFHTASIFRFSILRANFPA